MALNGKRITVVGGGTAGLAAARAMALRGAEVRLCEQAPDITEVGAGLQISPNGICVVDALGLGAALRDVSLPADQVVLRDGGTASGVLTLDLARGRGEYLLVHRARLIEVLLAGAREAGVDVALNTRIAPAEATGTVVAADGLHSRHRAALNGDRAAGFTGQAAWRAVIEDDPAAARMVQVFMGPGRHLVSYPLKGGLRNIVAVEERADWVAEGWAHEDAPEAVRAAFAGFGGPVRDWLDRITTVHLWGLFRHPVARRWSDGRIFLAGDAAHPTLPFLAQGANMALEDALILARVLNEHPDASAGPIYQTARQLRTERIVAAATANARNYHLSGAPRLLAHTALRALSVFAPAQALRRFNWLYGYDAAAVRLSGA